jgi:hypothetical protein
MAIVDYNPELDPSCKQTKKPARRAGPAPTAAHCHLSVHPLLTLTVARRSTMILPLTGRALHSPPRIKPSPEPSHPYQVPIYSCRTITPDPPGSPVPNRRKRRIASAAAHPGVRGAAASDGVSEQGPLLAICKLPVAGLLRYLQRRNTSVDGAMVKLGSSVYVKHSA